MDVKQMLEGKRDAKKGKNKGFSLVELIIVIAIMAIMVGVVGTQVLPYIEKSRQSKDYQVISSYCTAAATAYSANAASVASTGTITVDLGSATAPTGDAKIIYDELKSLTGFSTVATLASGMESKAGKDITNIVVAIDLDTKKITVTTTQGTPATYVDVFKVITGKL